MHPLVLLAGRAMGEVRMWHQHVPPYEVESRVMSLEVWTNTKGIITAAFPRWLTVPAAQGAPVHATAT